MTGSKIMIATSFFLFKLLEIKKRSQAFNLTSSGGYKD